MEFLSGAASGVQRWASAIPALDTQRQLLHRHKEQEALAKAAFLIGDFELSLFHIQQLIDEIEKDGTKAQPQLWCIATDNLERLGRPFAEAETRCLKQP